MKRYRSTYSRKPRTKKVRPLVRLRERVASKGGKCAGCRQRYEKGDLITAVVVKRRVYHRATCVPVNAAASFSPGASVAATPDSVATALSARWTEGEAKAIAMLALENAMVVVAAKRQITPEMEKAFEKYNKLKGVVTHVPTLNQAGATPAEQSQAFRMAINEIVKIVF